MSALGINILVAVSTSLAASLIWWFFSQLYLFQARNQIHFLLMTIREESRAYEKYLAYKDYDNALLMSRRIQDNLGEILFTVRPLTYFTRKKRLLINLLINNLYIAVNSFVRQHIGHSGDIEKEACCEKALRHIYVVGYEYDSEYENYPNPLDYQPITSITAELLIDLNLNRRSAVEKTIGNCFCFNCSSIDVRTKQKYFTDLICADAFKNNYSIELANKYNIITKVLTQENYIKIVSKFTY